MVAMRSIEALTNGRVTLMENDVDENGNPAGGLVHAVGINVEWQNGPLGRGDERQEPNGAFVEDLVHIAAKRINHYQEAASGKFACRENALALTALQEAGHWLNERTAQREDRAVEGTHTP